MNKWNLKHNTTYNSIQEMKYLGINQTKYVQYLYEENYIHLIGIPGLEERDMGQKRNVKTEWKDYTWGFSQGSQNCLHIKITWEADFGTTSDIVFSLDWDQGEGTDKGESLLSTSRWLHSAPRFNDHWLVIKARQLIVPITTGFKHNKFFLDFGNYNVIHNIKMIPCLKLLWSKVY